MHLSGSAVDEMEPWMLAAACAAWNAANTTPQVKAPSDEEYRAALAKVVK
jgi:hypothetical protein